MQRCAFSRLLPLSTLSAPTRCPPWALRGLSTPAPENAPRYGGPALYDESASRPAPPPQAGDRASPGGATRPVADVRSFHIRGAPAAAWREEGEMLTGRARPVLAGRGKHPGRGQGDQPVF